MKRWILASLLLLGGSGAADTVTLVDVIPFERSDEAEQDSEPTIAVNPLHPNELVISALTPAFNFCETSPTRSSTWRKPVQPVYISHDGGLTWGMQCILPIADSPPNDITVQFG